MDSRPVIFASEDTDHNPKPLYLTGQRRARHVLMCGAGGHAKDQVLRGLIAQDIFHGRGVVVLDGTGRFAADLLHTVPPSRAHDTIYLNPTHPTQAMGFNPLRAVPVVQRPRAAQEMLELFRQIWGLSLDHHPLLLTFLHMALLVLMDAPNATMVALYRFFQDEAFRERIVAGARPGVAKTYWEDFATWPKQDRRDKPQSVLTRLQAFVADPLLCGVLGQPKAALDFADVLQQQQVLLLDVPRRDMGAESALLLGSLFATRLRLAVETVSPAAAVAIYVPDCHHLPPSITSQLFQTPAGRSYATLSLGGLFDYGPAIRSSFLEADTLLAFRLGSDDARLLANRFDLAQTEEALQTLAPDSLAASHMPHELRSIDYIMPRFRQRKAILQRSRKAFCSRRGLVAAKLRRALSSQQPQSKLAKKPNRRTARKTVRPTELIASQRDVGRTVFSTFHDAPVRIDTVTETTVSVRLMDGQLVEHPRGREA
ncbi:hypothetical protein [uncultured Tateyamaria sp.]|nr:hypothetical protein [uncultured Tateyamaria sp.]